MSVVPSSSATPPLHYLEIAELARRLRTRQISPVAVAQAQLERIASLDSALGSYAWVMADLAMAQAEAAEAEIAAGHYRGALHGVPIAVKDICWTKGYPTAAGMAIYKNHRPPGDATVVRRLREAGAVLLGKLQLTEGAYSDYHPSVTPPENPWNREYWAGISSSGAAVATAAGMCYGALGSDTGGSIRWPAAANGVTGFKPTWGRVSRYGIFELAGTMDHIGPITRSALDAGLMLGGIAGRDPKDPTALLDPVDDYEATTDLRGLRIGVDADWNAEDVDYHTQVVLSQAIEVFRALGGTMIEVHFPDVTQAIEDWPLNCAVEAAVAHDATYPARKGEYGRVLASVIETGYAVSGVEYQKILIRRLGLRGRVAALFGTIDLLLIPVHPFAPPTVAMIRTLGEQPELIKKLQRYTCPFDMTGIRPSLFPAAFQRKDCPSHIS